MYGNAIGFLDEQFFDMAGLSEQDVNNDIELMDADGNKKKQITEELNANHFAT